MAILPALVDKGAIIQAHDRKGMEAAKELLPTGITYMGSAIDALEGVDAIVLMTEWNQYRGLDLRSVMRKKRGKTFIELRDVYEPDEMERMGFNYYCAGRGAQSAK